MAKKAVVATLELPTLELSTNTKNTSTFAFSNGDKFTLSFEKDGSIKGIKKGTKAVSLEASTYFVVGVNDKDIPFYDRYFFNSMTFLDKDGNPAVFTFNAEHMLTSFKDVYKGMTINYLPRHGSDSYNQMALSKIKSVVESYPIGMVFALDTITGGTCTLEVISGRVQGIINE